MMSDPWRTKKVRQVCPPLPVQKQNVSAVPFVPPRLWIWTGNRTGLRSVNLYRLSRSGSGSDHMSRLRAGSKHGLKNMADGPKDFRDPKVTPTGTATTGAETTGGMGKWIGIGIAALVALLLLAWIFGAFADDEGEVDAGAPEDSTVIEESN